MLNKNEQLFGIIVFICCLLLLITSCGEGIDEVEKGGEVEDYRSPPPELLTIQPPDGSEIPANGKLRVTFKRSASLVTVNGEAVTVEYGKESGVQIGFGREIIIVEYGTMVFKPKGLVPNQAAPFVITWENQNGINFKHTITLNVVDFDYEPPKIIDGNVFDGAKSVDPELLNRNGIWVEYSEDVIGFVNLFLKDGKTNLSWLAITKGNRTIIEPTKGVGFGGTYRLQGTIQDNACNVTQVGITFTTCDHPYLKDSFQILGQWSSFEFAFSKRQVEKIPRLWTGTASDFILFDTANKGSIEAQGSVQVQKTLRLLADERADKESPGDIGGVYIREREGQLQGSLSASNALRGGHSWAYFEKINGEWFINKVESVDPENLANHFNIEIHEDNLGGGIGYFDDPEFLVECK